MEGVASTGQSVLENMHKELLKERAKKSYSEDNFNGAADDYTELITLGEKDCQTYVDRGKCYIRMGLDSDALQDAKTAIQEDPSNVDAYIVAGRAAVDMKQYEDALAFYQRGLKVDPKNQEIATDLRGMQKVIVKDYEAKCQEKGYSAVKFCSQDAYPGDKEILAMEEEILEKKFLRKVQSAQNGSGSQTTNGAKARNPKGAMEEAMAGEQFKIHGDLQRAVHHLTLSIQLDPMNFGYRSMRAQVYYQDDDLRSAIADLLNISKVARHKETWKLGGLILRDLGLPVMAELWFRRATKLSPAEDDEAAMLFQQVRVSRLYDPLTEQLPVTVNFVTYGRAIFAKTDIAQGTIAMRDEPIICGNSLDTWKLPACYHCGRSMMTADGYFQCMEMFSEGQRQLIGELWPTVTPVPCDLCFKEVYCSDFCKQESWERYHSVLCPSKTPAAAELYDICDNCGKQYDKETEAWVEVWGAAFTPMILAKMWAFVVCQVKRMMTGEGTLEPTLEQWAKAKAPLRKFIAFGCNETSPKSPKIFDLMQRIFSTCDPVVQYKIDEREYLGRYFQASCNLQSFSSSLNPYKIFLNKLSRIDPLKTMTMLKLVEKKADDVLFTGLFPLHACINHSCDNNVEVMDGEEKGKPGIWVKIKKDIKAGEELFTTYIDTSLPRKLRRAWLYRSFNFWCQCQRCQFEGDDPETCTNCLTKSSTGKKFSACGKCRKAWYCTVKCQKQSWQKGHRAICKTPHSTTFATTDKYFDLNKMYA